MYYPMHYSRRLLLSSSNISQAQQTKVDTTIADTKNGAYPV